MIILNASHPYAPRLDSLERVHDGGTEENRTAAALNEAVSAIVLALESENRGPNRGRPSHHWSHSP
ncbi:hypothetical protein ACGFNV_35285 [Streptomyces sp. NPDC048751]|uniref:hypothetical protein n=1 Tax=Streptomyces sp. NPDC048751 TaxID=3365591 RepID=UPI00371EAF79